MPGKNLAAILALSLPMFFSCDKAVREDVLSPSNPRTLTFYNADMTDYILFKDPVAREITRRTGITLDITPLKTSVGQDISMMITADRYQDLIYAKSEITELIDKKAVIALDDWISPGGEHVNLIEAYGKNLKDLYGKELVKLRHTDGHIYSFGTYDVKNAVNETYGYMQIQHSVLKELGYPRLQTLEDFSNAIRAYKKKHPTIGGKATIGLSLLTSGWRWYVGLSNPGNYSIGYPDDGQWIVDRETHRAQYKFLNPEMATFYRWLNRLYADGLLDPESFTQSEEVWKAKVSSGTVLSLASPEWEFDEPCKNLVADGMSERTYAYLPIVADAKKYKDPSLTDYGFSGGWGISISKDCEDVILAFKFMDWMCSEEAQILTNWGIKGVNYEITDGKRSIPETEQQRILTDSDYSRKTGVGLWTYPFPERGKGAQDSNGDWITKNSVRQIIDSYLPVEKETLRAYGAKMWTELFPQSGELYKPLHGQIWQYNLSQDLSRKVSDADDFVHKTLIECIVNPADEFDARWSAMVEKLKEMGMEEAGDKLSEMIQEKLELWGVTR